MKTEETKRDSGSESIEDESAEARCCYVIDPCGCYVDPCGCYVPDPCGCVVDCCC